MRLPKRIRDRHVPSAQNTLDSKLSIFVKKLHLIGVLSDTTEASLSAVASLFSLANDIINSSGQFATRVISPGARCTRIKPVCSCSVLARCSFSDWMTCQKSICWLKGIAVGRTRPRTPVPSSSARQLGISQSQESVPAAAHGVPEPSRMFVQLAHQHITCAWTLRVLFRFARKGVQD